MKSRRSIWMSGLSLLICIAMLAGTTFAWFSDSISNKNNRIQAGRLDIQLFKQVNPVTVVGELDTDDLWEEVTNQSGAILNANDFDNWQPGDSVSVWLAVKNNGSIDLKYNIDLLVTADELAEALLFGMTSEENAIPSGAIASVVVSSVINSSNIIPAATNGLLGEDDVDYINVVIEFSEFVGNTYNTGNCAFEFDLILSATQTNGVIAKAYDEASLITALNTDGATVFFMSDITLSGNVTTYKHVNIDTNGYTLDLGDKILTFGQTTTNYAVYTITGNFTNGTIALDNVNGHFNVHNGLDGANLTIEGTYSNSAEVSGKWGKIDVNGNKVGKTTLNDVDVDELNVNTPAPIIGSGTFGKVNVNGGNEEDDQGDEPPKANVTFQGSDTNIGELNINEDLLNNNQGGGDEEDDDIPPVTLGGDFPPPATITVVDDKGAKSENQEILNSLVKTDDTNGRIYYKHNFSSGINEWFTTSGYNIQLSDVDANGNFKVVNKAFSRMGGYRNEFPGSWQVSVDVYLDLATAKANDILQISIAPNRTDGTHFRDNFITIIKDAAGFFWVSAENGSGNQGDDISSTIAGSTYYTDSARKMGQINTSGWYTLKWNFYVNTATTSLTFRASVEQNGTEIMSIVREGITNDMIKWSDSDAAVGFNRYLWVYNCSEDAGYLMNNVVLQTLKAQEPIYTHKFSNGLGDWVSNIQEPYYDSDINDKGQFIVKNQAFSRFGEFRSEYLGAWEASIDVYLDMNADYASALQTCVAITRTTGAHLRDYFINIIKDNDAFKLAINTGSGTSTSRFDPNAGYYTSNLMGTITTSGWYTLKWTFFPDAANNNTMSCRFSVMQNGIEIMTRTLKGEANDLDVAGLNRYMWVYTCTENQGFLMNNQSLRLLK